MSFLTTHALRFMPGQDLRQEIQNYINEKSIKAGWIATCVGSLVSYAIRFANQPLSCNRTGHFETLIWLVHSP
jgi:predicted DNA-binding protein with PD1-like motif